MACALVCGTVLDGASASKPLTSDKVNAPLAVWLKPIRASGLKRDHTAYAMIAAGKLRIPDGALPLPGVGQHITPAAPAPAKTGMGETRSLPSLRIPPNKKWHRLQRKGWDEAWARGAARQEENRKSFLPASMFPGFEAHASDATEKPDSANPKSRFKRGHISPVAFDVTSSDLAAAAGQELSKLAQKLKNDARPVKLRAYTENQTPTVSEYRLALQRAWAVRSFLMMRGITKDRIMVHAVTPRPQDTSPHRVDVLYTSG